MFSSVMDMERGGFYLSINLVSSKVTGSLAHRSNAPNGPPATTRITLVQTITSQTDLGFSFVVGGPVQNVSD